MHQHRSSAIRVLVGGALATALGAASAAWACTPQAVLHVKEVGRSETPMSRQVELTVSHREPSADGQIVIAEGNVLVDAEVTPIETAPMIKGRAVKVQKVVNLTVAGYHYFSSWMTDGTNVIQSSLKTEAYLVQRATAPADDPRADDPPADKLVATPINPSAGPTDPVSHTRPAPGAVTSPEALPVEPPDRSQAPSSAGTPAAPRSVAGAPTAAVAPAGQAVREPASADASPAVSTRSLGFQAPDPSSLWSGLDPSRAPSLLEGPVTEGDSGRIPVGGGLVALGLLSLAGVAAVGWRQRLAVARLSKRG